MSRKQKIAALLTCYNRREKTLACLDGLASQTRLDDAEIHVILVDDGSTDGTSDAVSQRFPGTTLIQGDGSLYWNGGMRLAMDAAIGGDFDYFLWVNDDTTLQADAVRRLIDTHGELATQHANPVIVVGSIRDPETGELTYGGSVPTSRWTPLRFRRLEPGKSPVRCDVFNGNCVLLPRAAVEATGNLHPDLVHAAGDYEYGLRAARHDVASFIAPGYYGECERNPRKGTWQDPALTLREQYRQLLGTKGQPLRPRLSYYSRNGGPLWFVMYPLVYLRPLIASAKRALKLRDAGER